MEQILIKNISIPDWSFKNIDSDAYRKLEKSIQKNGQMQTIVVRHLGEDKYEVIDGKIVFEILRKLDIDFVWCKVIRNISRIESKLLYMQLDYNFNTDYIELAKTVRKLSKNHSSIKISRLVNLSVKEINDLIKLNEFDFEKYKPISKAEQNSFF